VAEITGTLRDLAYRHVTRVIDFSLAPTSTRNMNLALGIDASIESQSLVLRKRETVPAAPVWDQLQLPLPGVVAIHRPEWVFHLTQIEGSRHPGSEPTRDPWLVRLDAVNIRLPLFLRTRRQGDRFLPAGMPGAVKLNDFLAAHHLPRAERDRWPLVCDGEGILWIPGFRLREGAIFKEGSQRGMEIRIERNFNVPARIDQEPGRFPEFP
jgi:tRNA(Ile)-lysidine synthase